jgi:hypothetical protein
MELEASTIVSRSPDVVFERVEGSILVLDPGGSYVQLNATGSELWSVLDEPSSIDALARHLVAHHSVDPDRASHDVVSFVAGLRERNLVECAVG